MQCAPAGVRIETIWNIKEKLGQGTFGTVRRVIRKNDKKIAAVKIIKKKSLSKQELQTLDREKHILKKADHPNCVKLFDIFETKHHLYLVMELCEGGELFDAICNDGTFNESRAADIVKQITDALAYLHDNNIVHRDLKPENLLFATKEQKIIKLMDFGLAKALDQGDEVLKTRCGTLHYVAPEVLEKVQYYTNKCDFWSLGVVLYVLLCGYLPFYHEERSITVKLIRSGEVLFDEEEWGDISEDAKDLIRKLLEKDPKTRYNAEQITNHPFITKIPNSAHGNRTFDKQFQDNFKQTKEIMARERATLLCAQVKANISINRWLKKACNIVGKKPPLVEQNSLAQSPFEIQNKINSVVREEVKEIVEQEKKQERAADAEHEKNRKLIIPKITPAGSQRL